VDLERHDHEIRHEDVMRFATQTPVKTQRSLALVSTQDRDRQCRTLSAEIDLIGAFSDAVAQGRDVERALEDVLERCLYHADVPRAAICVRATWRAGDPSSGFLVLAHRGFTNVPQTLTTLAADRETLRRATEDRTIGTTSAGVMLIPLVSVDEVIGVLMLDTSRRAQWNELVQGIARQVSAALALARRFERVEASERRAKTLMEHADEAIVVVSMDGCILETNRAAERLLGASEAGLIGRPYTDFVRDIPTSGSMLTQRAAAEGASAGTMEVIRPNGSTATVECTVGLVDVGNECAYVTFLRDVSERNALAERLKGAQKLEAIGRLSGGVAHDFNNLLSVVLSYADLLLADFADNEEVRLDLMEIRKAGMRAADLARQILVFGRDETPDRQMISLNDVVASVEKLLRRLIGADIELTTSAAADLGSVYADATHLHQILMNLVINARDAMPDGGRLRISTGNIDVMPGHEDPEIGLPAGRYVRLTVVDSGIGMDAATIAKIFQPFFTTKSPDRGTGLGLATVKAIVEQAGGKIRVTSQPGKGARFHIYLPRVDVPSVRRRNSSTMPTAVSGGHETVLVVEDEPQVRELLVDILERAGYNVVEAANGGEALLIAEEEGSPIHLLLSDLVMPRLNGDKLADRLRAMRPEMKVLFMSGYVDGRLPWRERISEGGRILSKPVTPAALVARVREVLGTELRQQGGLS
jgi:two-component system, cell cycle sensor histidine kinase and response regulator CckA